MTGCNGRFFFSGLGQGAEVRTTLKYDKEIRIFFRRKTCQKGTKNSGLIIRRGLTQLSLSNRMPLVPRAPAFGGVRKAVF